MRTIRLVIEYDGTAFVGWQMQPNGRSVQEEVTRVLRTLVQEEVSVIGAGRTDAGVHARGQVAGFKTGSVLPAARLLAALNGLLPDDICVHAVDEVSEDFHARYGARERRYSYTIATRPLAIGRRYCWELRTPLDVDAMNRLAVLITGEHDFEAFCKYAADVDHYRCTVLRAGWTRGEGRLVFDITANRFLHGMVRALVGTMVEVGRGYTPEASFGTIMESRDRKNAGMAAPASGLVLEEVRY